MAERDIILEDVRQPGDLFRLKEYLRELYSLIDRRQVIITNAASVVLDADQADSFYILLDGNITSITLKNPAKGRRITIIFLQDGTGSRTVAGFGAEVMLAGNAFSVTADANRYTTITLEYEDENSKWVEVNRTSDVY